MTCGQIVIVKSGRDKGHAMVVLEVSEGYLFLVDGRLRTLKKPKKKKVKHVQITHHFVNMQPESGRDLQDADIRKQLTAFAGRR